MFAIGTHLISNTMQKIGDKGRFQVVWVNAHGRVKAPNKANFSLGTVDFSNGNLLTFIIV